MSSILVVCTGNICRSPMAEGILSSLLAERGIHSVVVESAGTEGWEGSPAMPEAVEALSESGIAIDAHTARRLSTEMLARADLVVAMAEEHAEAAVAMMPDTAGRTFTIKELVKLLDEAGEVRRPGRSPEPGRVDPAGALRAAAARADNARREDPPEIIDRDIADPLGLGLHAFRAAAWELQGLCERLVDDVFGAADDSRAGPQADAPTGTEGGGVE